MADPTRAAATQEPFLNPVTLRGGHPLDGTKSLPFGNLPPKQYVILCIAEIIQKLVRFACKIQNEVLL